MAQLESRGNQSGRETYTWLVYNDSYVPLPIKMKKMPNKVKEHLFEVQKKHKKTQKYNCPGCVMTPFTKRR